MDFYNLCSSAQAPVELCRQQTEAIVKVFKPVVAVFFNLPDCPNITGYNKYSVEIIINGNSYIPVHIVRRKILTHNLFSFFFSFFSLERFILIVSYLLLYGILKN